MISMAETFNIDGELIPMSQAWRIVVRSTYRRARRGGYGPMGARMIAEQVVR